MNENQSQVLSKIAQLFIECMTLFCFFPVIVDETEFKSNYFYSTHDIEEHNVNYE